MTNAALNNCSPVRYVVFLPMETWKEIPDFKGYFISSEGHVKTADYNHTGKESQIKIFKNSYGYMACNLMRGNIRKRKLVHRLVAEAFVANPQGLATVNHINGVKTDNRVDNLEWLTSADNTRHAHKNGMVEYAGGETHYKSKLSTVDVIKIKALIKAGVGNTQIAQMFGVVHQTISDIRRGRNRKYETDRNREEVFRSKGTAE